MTILSYPENYIKAYELFKKNGKNAFASLKTKTYKNHHIFKQNRLEVLKKYPICQVCNKDKSAQAHHKDLSKYNHDRKNLIAVCLKCHRKTFHSGSGKQTSKYKRFFGYYEPELRKMGIIIHAGTFFRYLDEGRFQDGYVWLKYGLT